jgi:hypothetical protein
LYRKIEQKKKQAAHRTAIYATRDEQSLARSSICHHQMPSRLKSEG